MSLKRIFGLSLLTLLSACQLTVDENVATIELEQEHQIAEQILNSCEGAQQGAADLFDCEAAKAGTIPVTHPVAEVDIPLPLSPTLTQEPSSIAAKPQPEAIIDIWQRVSQQFAFEYPENRRIKVQRDWYLKHHNYMKRVAKRAQPFLYLIVEELENNNMPLELVLLPIVESAFDPFAYSHGRAAGMWQFIPSTGKRFGMKQNWWYDGRRDVMVSTKGAIDYLNYLHKLFDGDWLHALAAYNSGEGRVGRAIRKNKKAGKPSDFWNLDLPRETRAYVPKLLALADMLSNSKAYNFDWPKIDNKAVTELVDVGSQIDLALAADLANLTVQELHALNPGYNRWATDPDGPFKLLLPIDRVEAFTLALQKTENDQRLNWVRHQIKSGDSLLKLAKDYHTTPEIIAQVNELKGNMIRAGKYLVIPVALKSLDYYSLSQEQRLVSKQSRKNGAFQIKHRVKTGDTMWDLSREHNVTVKKLASWNGMAPKDMLRPGKDLVIWVNKLSPKQSDNGVMRTLTYTVRNGDSLAKIAGKFKVQVNELRRWNKLDPKKYLQPGQKIKVFVDVTRT